jgi:hypothetical protein
MTEGMPIADWIDWYLFTAGMNIDYHQRMAWWWDAANKMLIAMAIACGGWCIYASAKRKLAESSLRWSIAALVFMAVCLLIPAGDFSHQYQSLARRWGGIESEIKSLERLAARDTPSDEKVATIKEDIEREIGAIEQDESAPHDWLLNNCWARQAERFYGKGINTPEKIDEYRKEHNLPPIEYGGPSSVAADHAVEAKPGA